jgi:hypothetical protein
MEIRITCRRTSCPRAIPTTRISRRLVRSLSVVS